MDDAEKARNRLVTAGLKYASATWGGADSSSTVEERGRAKDSLDLAARLYVEQIGPRVADEAEPDPHTATVSDAVDEEG